MTSAKYIILEHVCPAFGLILSNLMYSAPFRDAQAAVKRGYLGSLNSTPWVFMTGSSIGWLTYAFLISNVYIYFANIFGLILSIWLNLSAMKLQHSEFRVREVRQSVVQYLEEEDSLHHRVVDEDQPDEMDDSLMSKKAVDYGKIVLDVTAQKRQAPVAQELILLVLVVIWLAIISVISFADLSSATRELIVGLAANANLIFFFGAPLSTMLTVLRTRNSASIHIRTMVMNTATGAFWAAYGIAISDPFVYAFNALGAGLGVVQVFLVMSFPRTPIAEGGGKGPSEDAVESSSSTIETGLPMVRSQASLDAPTDAETE